MSQKSNLKPAAPSDLKNKKRKSNAKTTVSDFSSEDDLPLKHGAESVAAKDNGYSSTGHAALPNLEGTSSN